MIDHLAKPVPAETERLATIVVDAGFKVHKTLGPGLLESAYEHCLAYELAKRGLDVKRQVPQPIVYDGASLEVGHRIDILVNRAIVIEVKAVEATTPVHVAQLLTYLHLSGCRIGFLMNFSTPTFKSGIRRLAV
jgi:GxxExxY protein